MTASTILETLVRINLVASVAILVVLLLRPVAMRRLGASIAYWLWLIVPIAVAMSYLPARERIRVVAPPRVVAASADSSGLVIGGQSAAPDEVLAQIAPKPLIALPSLADLLVALWLLGAGALLARSIISTRRLAADPMLGPALVGVLRPKLVLPADFETRFDAEERALILAHEEIHRVSGHTLVNALVELARCASWFNPLGPLASSRVRTDQELACDAAVIAARPAARRAYAQALLKTQVAPAFVPLGCTWTSPSAARMRERITMLGRPSLSRPAAVAGAAAVAVLGCALGYAAWAQRPERQVMKVAGWDAPPGLLSPIQAFRHEQFLPRAKAGNIDVVFFGDAGAEFWLWKNRGRSVWDSAFASFRAADFGAQGATTLSTLWRMQHGELQGYRAKAVVLYALHSADGTERGHDVDAIVDGHEAIIAEIRKQQPQAKILLVANVRKWFPSLGYIGEVNARLAELADDQSIFFIDFSDRFRGPGGSINPDMWSIGMRTPGYVVWAEEIKPWLDRFGR